MALLLSARIAARGLGQQLPACTAIPPQRLRLPSTTSRARPQTAHFHESTCRRQASSADSITSGTDAYFSSGFEEALHALAETLHTTGGLAWASAIPLSAVAIRALCLPLTISSRAAQQRWLDVQPLASAWRVKLRHNTRWNYAASKDSVWMGREYHRKLREELRGLKRRWRCGWLRRSTGALVQVPLFLGMAEVYRRMCGLQQSFLSSLLTGLFSLGKAQQPMQLPVDPSLAVEGALWFPDLTVPDATGQLAAAVVAMNLGMLWWQTYRSWSRLAPGESIGRRQAGLTVGGTGLILLLPVITSGLPAGVMLYWASSTAVNLATRALLAVVMPLRRSPAPCKRPAKIAYDVRHTPS